MGTSTGSLCINYLGSQPAEKLYCKLQLLLVKLDAITDKRKPSVRKCRGESTV